MSYFVSALSKGARVALSPCQRIMVAAGSAVTAFANPERGDMVATLGEVTGQPALMAMRRRMMEDETGREILESRPRIRDHAIDWEALGRLPRSTLGGAYFEFMESHGFSADSRAEVLFVEDEELAYVMQRYREVHDFFHVLTGLPPNVTGEVALKWFEMVHTGLPMCALSAFVGPLRVSAAERAVLRSIYIPWAAEAGKTSRFLLNVRYEDCFETELDDLRAHLRLEPAPVSDVGAGGSQPPRDSDGGNARSDSIPTGTSTQNSKLA